MTRAAKVAAALERWEVLFSGEYPPTLPETIGAGGALAALLRESQPEPAPCPGCGGNGEIEGGAFTAFPCSKCGGTGKAEPAPVVGREDGELIRVARGAALSPVIERPVRNLLEDLATRLEAALADVARERAGRIQAEAERDRVLLRDDDALAKSRADVARERERADTNLANAKEVQQKWCDESNRAIRLEDELEEARAALAAAEQEKEKAVAESAKVRRIASYVDPMVWIAAKEKAGHATTIRARAGRNDG